MKMRNTLENKNTERQETATPRLMLRLLALALLVVGGWSGAVGQTYETGTLDEGFFYIVHNQDRTYSLCPAEDPTDHAIGKWYDTGHTMPFLTTKKTNLPDDYRLWHLTKNSSGNFQMIHAKDNKYVINDKAGKEPEAVHLDVLPENGTNTWYVINYVSNGGYYNIKSISVTNNYSINPYSGNKDNYDGNGGGIIGYWDNGDNGSKWQFVKMLPIITNDAGNFTISFLPAISGQQIYYTTDNSDPRTSGTRQPYSVAFQLAGSETKVKACVELNGHYSDVAIYNTLQCATPVITNTDGVIDMTCATPGTSIYYTTDGSTPTPNSTLFTSLTLPLNTNIATIRAIAVSDPDYSDISEVASLNIVKCATPSIVNTFNGEVTMISTSGATIRYTTDGSNPNTNSPQYSIPNILLPDDNTIEQIKAIAYKAGMRPSDIKTYYVPQCDLPVITNNDGTITITCGINGAHIHYATSFNGSFSDYTDPFPLGSAPIVRAYASHAGYRNSPVTMLWGVLTEVSSTEEMSDMNGGYKLAAGFTVNGSIGSADHPFTGVIDGQFNTIASTSSALVAYADGAIIKNVVIGNATVSGTGNVGAICNEATGNTRIYNCGVQGGSVTSSNGAAGSLVGHIAAGGSVRVVNCYNYASVGGSTFAAGVVGYNESTAADGTRIAMCMMYGDITSGATISPVYCGNHVSNNRNYTEYNYWRYRANLDYTDYNDQLAIDKDRFLTRFPFYRHILNTHREMAALFLFGNTTVLTTSTAPTEDEIAEIGHWALKEDVAPYPIVEPWETNTHRITQDLANNLPNTSADYAGRLLTEMGNNGNLAVTVKIGTETYSCNLPITDMDSLHYDFTWGKVVLPFANEFSGWTRDYSKVCTGWKITSVTKGGSTYTSFNIPANEPYNFADRDNPQKDIYDATNNPYIFAQGGNFIVPYEVTAITIEANFANAYYLSDPYADIAYNNVYKNPTNIGWQVPATYHGQTVYTDLTTLFRALSDNNPNPNTQAIVLVGNFHYNVAANNGEIFKNFTKKGVTIMSADEDNNQEPDYGWYSFMGEPGDDRQAAPPLRFDFVPNIGIGMSARVTGSSRYPTIGIFNTRGWFELTETCVSIMNETETEDGAYNSSDDQHGNNRWIANSGYFLEFVRGFNSNATKLSYVQIGGNAYVEKFYPGGPHFAKTPQTKLCPVLVTGGELEECFMTGKGQNANVVATGDNIYFWCAGGRIHKWLGAYMVKPQSTNCKVTARLDHAIVRRFFGGGTSPLAAITGDIDVTVNNSFVNFYCGGPEFGNMNVNDGKAVTTRAKNTVFGEFYGAGFGGTAITYENKQDNTNITFDQDYPFPLSFDNYTDYRLVYDATNGGFGTCYYYDFIMYAGGKNAKGVARFYVGRSAFSLATTGSVTNELENCTVLRNFYGAGCQGKVNGTVTSTLTDCTIMGSAFGGGYKATSNEVPVYPTTSPTFPTYYWVPGVFSDFIPVAPETWTWEQGPAGTKDEPRHVLYTDVVLSELGNVTNDISITIEGNSTVRGNVFGGGHESRSQSDTFVLIKDHTKVFGNIYGGGNMGVVEGNTKVVINGQQQP